MELLHLSHLMFMAIRGLVYQAKIQGFFRKTSAPGAPFPNDLCGAMQMHDDARKVEVMGPLRDQSVMPLRFNPGQEGSDQERPWAFIQHEQAFCRPRTWSHARNLIRRFRRKNVRSTSINGSIGMTDKTRIMARSLLE